jgi:Fe-S cluster biogenesis protein NfuA
MDTMQTYIPDVNLTEEDRLRGLIEFLSAYIEQFHGGWVRMLAFDGKQVSVEMGGACIGCTLASSTLHGWVEGTVKQFFPDVEAVTAITIKSPVADPNKLEISG